jgi:MFS family permease
MVQAVLQAASAPARRTFVPRLVPPDQLTAAIALNTLSGRITMLFGPALAGLIAAAWGLKTCYAVDTVSFVASLYATARLPATVASLTTPAVSAVSGGLGCLAIAALIGLLYPAFARYRAAAG